MKCPGCGFGESKVIDSRPLEDGSGIRRRRECLSCARRFNTYEVVDATPLLVVKKNGDKQLFDRGKILSGLMKACYKRPVSGEQMQNLITDVERELRASFRDEATSREVGELVMVRLKELDEVSYVRFASVYRSFTDAATFLSELEVIVDKSKDVN